MCGIDNSHSTDTREVDATGRNSYNFVTARNKLYFLCKSTDTSTQYGNVSF